MHLRVLPAAVLFACVASEVSAIVIDDFTQGPIAHDPETNLDLFQNGLPAANVVGGQRDWFALYGGSLTIDDAAGSLNLSHDHGPYEVAILQYGNANSTSDGDPLNLDVTADSHSQFTVRVNRVASADSINHPTPIRMQLTLFSGVGEAGLTGHAVHVRPRASDGPFVLQFPFSRFEEVDLSDVDCIYSSFHFDGFGELEIAEIATSAGLPGDYNLNGDVDAGDYTLWRDNVGKSSLPNRNPATTGDVGAADYDFWKARFGDVFPAASEAIALPASGVPEPTTLVSLIAAIAAARICHRRR